MVNEKRVRLMTKMALFERKNGKELEKVQTYFRSDYIGVYLVKNGFRISIVYLIGLMAWGCYHFDTLVNELTKMDIGSFVFKILFIYLVVLCSYLVITYILLALQYAKSVAEYDRYQAYLRLLEREYDKEEARKEANRHMGGKRYE